MCRVVLENLTGIGYHVASVQEIQEDTTVKEFLSELGLADEYGYFSVLINGRVVPLSTVLRDGDRIVLVPLMTSG
jgi:sulfur carrier protein ThiS